MFRSFDFWSKPFVIKLVGLMVYKNVINLLAFECRKLFVASMTIIEFKE